MKEVRSSANRLRNSLNHSDGNDTTNSKNHDKEKTPKLKKKKTIKIKKKPKKSINTPQSPFIRYVGNKINLNSISKQRNFRSKTPKIHSIKKPKPTNFKRMKTGGTVKNKQKSGATIKKEKLKFCFEENYAVDKKDSVKKNSERLKNDVDSEMKSSVGNKIGSSQMQNDSKAKSQMSVKERREKMFKDSLHLNLGHKFQFFIKIILLS